MLPGLEKKQETEGLSEKDVVFVEVLREGQECPNCHFAKLAKEEGEIFCPICGYGHKGCG